MKYLEAIWRVTRATLPVVIGLIGLGVIIAWLAGVFETKIEPLKQPSQQAIVLDRPTETVHEVTKDYIEEAVGTLKASSRTVISAKVLARIDQITVSAGDQVSQGDVLIELDSLDLQARLAQAEQTLIAATATRKEAEISHGRSQKLAEKNAVSQAELDHTSRNLQVARAEELRAEQAINESKVMLGYATIKAPKIGRIVDRVVSKHSADTETTLVIEFLAAVQSDSRPRPVVLRSPEQRNTNGFPQTAQPRKDLTPAQIKAYRLADNKTAELTEWDYDLLPIELSQLGELNFDLELIGYGQKSRPMVKLHERLQPGRVPMSNLSRHLLAPGSAGYVALLTVEPGFSTHRAAASAAGDPISSRPAWGAGDGSCPA